MQFGKRNTNSDQTTKIKDAPRQAWKEDPEYRPNMGGAIVGIVEGALISLIIFLIVVVLHHAAHVADVHRNDVAEVRAGAYRVQP